MRALEDLAVVERAAVKAHQAAFGRPTRFEMLPRACEEAGFEGPPPNGGCAGGHGGSGVCAGMESGAKCPRVPCEGGERAAIAVARCAERSDERAEGAIDGWKGGLFFLRAL